MSLFCHKLCFIACLLNRMFVYLKLLWIDYKTPSEPLQIPLLSFLPQVTTCTLRRAVQDTEGTVLG